MLRYRFDALPGEDSPRDKGEPSPSFAFPDEETDFPEETSVAFLAEEFAAPDESGALQGVDVETDDDDYAGGDLAPALSDVSVTGPGWQAEAMEKEDEERLILSEPAPALYGQNKEEKEGAGWMSEQDESVTALEDHLDSFFEFEEEKEPPAPAGQSLSLTDEIPADGELAPAPSDISIPGPGWQAQDMGEEAEEQLILGEPAPALSGQVKEESEGVGWMSEQDEAVTALEDHLDSFFEFEEEKEPLAPTAQQTLSFPEEMSAGGPFEESIGEGIEAEVEEMAGVPEEYSALTEVTAHSDQPLAESAAVSPLFEMEEIGGEGAPEAAAEQCIAEGEEAEKEIVFDLADDNEELFADPFAEENLVEHATSEQEPLAAAAQDLPDIFQQSLESAEELTEQLDLATATVPEPETTARENGEFLAVFEEADETAEEDVWPDRIAAEEMQPEPEQAISADLEEKPVSTAEDEMPGSQSLFIEEEEPFPVHEDPLENLRACVSSVGIELEDSIFQGLYTEINDLRSRWATHPLEKSFLQLVSTITQHIERYRYEASSEAFSLFQSVVNAFGEALEWHHPAAAQEMLLKEMTKVLLWQQDMLNRQAVSKGDGWTFADPIRFQPGESLAEEEISFAGEDSENEISADFADVGADKAAEEDLTAMGEEFPMEKDIWFSATGPASTDFEQVLADEIAAVEVHADTEMTGSENHATPEVRTPAEQGPLADYDSDELDADFRVTSDMLYSELEAVLSGESIASADGDGIAADSLLTRQIIVLMQREFDLIRQEMHSQFEALRRELKEREN